MTARQRANGALAAHVDVDLIAEATWFTPTAETLAALVATAEDYYGPDYADAYAYVLHRKVVAQ